MSNHNDELAARLKAAEKQRAENEARRLAEVDSIWNKIGGPENMAAAPKAVKLMKSLLFYIVNGWYGVDSRVSQLKQIGERATALANIAWNTMNSFLRMDQEQSNAIHLRLTAVRERLVALRQSNNASLDDVLDVLIDLSDPDLFGYADADDYQQMLVHWGEVLFNESRSDETLRTNPVDALTKHVNNLIHAHRDEINDNLADALVKKKDVH